MGLVRENNLNKFNGHRQLITCPLTLSDLHERQALKRPQPFKKAAANHTKILSHRNKKKICRYNLFPPFLAVPVEFYMTGSVSGLKFMCERNSCIQVVLSVFI